MAWDLCSSPPHPRLLLSSVGFVRLRRTLNEFSVLFIKTTIAKLLRNVIFSSSPSPFGPKRKRKKKIDEKRISRPVFLDLSRRLHLHERNSSTRFLCENRETIVKVLGLSARLTSARPVIYRQVSFRGAFQWAFLHSRKSPLIQNGILTADNIKYLAKNSFSSPSSSSKLIHNRNINFRRSSKHIKSRYEVEQEEHRNVSVFSRRRRSLRCWLPETTSRVLRTSKRQYSPDDVSLSRPGTASLFIVDIYFY